MIELRPIRNGHKLLIRRSRIDIVLAIGFREEVQSLALLLSLAPNAYHHADDDDEEEEGESVAKAQAQIEEVAACDGWRFALGC